MSHDACDKVQEVVHGNRGVKAGVEFDEPCTLRAK